MQVSPQLDRSINNLLYPSYAYFKTLPVSGGTNFVINAGGSTEILLELVPKVYNLSKSILYFQIAILDANAAGLNTFQPWMWAEALGMINQIQLMTRTGTAICNLVEVQNYTAVVWKIFTKLQDYLTYDQAYNANLGGTNTTFPSGTVPMIGGTSHFFQPSHILPAGLTNHRHDNSQPYLAGYENLHFYTTTAVGNNAGAGSLILNVEFPLGLLYNTIFSLDKDLFFNETIVLRIQLNGSNRFAFTGLANTLSNDPSSGNATPNATTSSLALACNVSIQNLCVYLAIEQNIEIENNIRQSVMAGNYLMIVPYVITTKLAVPASGTMSVNIRYNSANGRRLRRIIWAPFNTKEQYNLSLDHSNLTSAGVPGDKIQNFYSSVNGQRLQLYTVDCQNLSGQQTDYLEMQKFLKGSVLMNSNLYMYNWFWMDEFGYAKSPSDNLYGLNEDNVLQGLSLETEKIYEIIANTQSSAGTSAAAGLIFYVFAVTEKLLSVGPAGISFG